MGVSATRSSKIWPLDYFLQVIHGLTQVKQVSIPIQFSIYLSKTEVDLKIYEHINKTWPLHDLPLSFHFVPLKELPLAFYNADFFLGNDSGLKHLAVALNVPTLTLFGPEPPREWHPYDSDKHPYFYKTEMPCRYEKGLHFCPSLIALTFRVLER